MHPRVAYRQASRGVHNKYGIKQIVKFQSLASAVLDERLPCILVAGLWPHTAVNNFALLSAKRCIVSFV